MVDRLRLTLSPVALAALVFAASAIAQPRAAKPAASASASDAPTRLARSEKDTERQVFAPAPMSQAAARVAQWIVASRDNGPLPFIIIDKKAATVFVYDSKGQQLGETPALVGIANGDDSTPGVASKTLAQLGPAEKTTPAGRFMSTIGPAVDGQKVLWLDYTTSVALHAVPTGNRKERRLERLLSPAVDDNRITFGCINVPAHFFRQRVRPIFEKTGGVVYVLPDTKPLEKVFPQLGVKPRRARPG